MSVRDSSSLLEYFYEIVLLLGLELISLKFSTWNTTESEKNPTLSSNSFYQTLFMAVWIKQKKLVDDL